MENLQPNSPITTEQNNPVKPEEEQASETQNAIKIPEQKETPAILQEKVDEILTLADKFDVLERERWNWTEWSEDFVEFNKVRERERYLVGGRLAKYNKVENMGSPHGLAYAPRPSGIVLDAESAGDLEDIKNQMLEVMRDIQKYPLTPEIPPAENRGNSVEQNEFPARNLEPARDNIANPDEIIKRATEDNLKRGINIAEMIKNQAGNQETSPSNMRSAVEEITSELLAEHTAIIGEQNEKIVRKFLETKINGELTAKIFETYRSRHSIRGALLLPGFGIHKLEQFVKGGWNEWQMKKLVAEGKLTTTQFQEIQNLSALDDNESITTEKEKPIAPAPAEEKKGAGNEREGAMESSSFYVKEKSRANKDHPNRNEDSMLNMPEKGAFVISDGMGGHAAGEVASSIVTDTARELFSVMPENLSLEEAKEFVKMVLLKSHERILEKMATDASLKGMGATATILLRWKGQNGEQKMITGNVGDSRSYLLRDNKLNQLTLDDNEFTNTIRRFVTQDDEQIRKIQKAVSNLPYEATGEELIQEIRKEGLKLSAEQEETIDSAFLVHNNNGELMRDRLSQVLGNKPGQKIEPQIGLEDVRQGDIVLLASDGLSENVFEKDMEQFLLEHKDDPDALEKFAELAYNSGRKPDDISAMMIELNRK